MNNPVRSPATYRSATLRTPPDCHQSQIGTKLPVRIIALSTLKAFIVTSHADAEQPLLAWYRRTLAADWATPSDLKADLGNASILRDGRVVFNIAGNKYRLVAWINYPYRVVYIRFVGTHAQYDLIDAQTI